MCAFVYNYGFITKCTHDDESPSCMSLNMSIS